MDARARYSEDHPAVFPWPERTRVSDDLAKEVMLWTRQKALKTDTFLFGQVFFHVFKFQSKKKVKMEREVLFFSKFVKRWTRIARMVQM